MFPKKSKLVYICKLFFSRYTKFYYKICNIKSWNRNGYTFKSKHPNDEIIL